VSAETKVTPTSIGTTLACTTANAQVQSRGSGPHGLGACSEGSAKAEQAAMPATQIATQTKVNRTIADLSGFGLFST
jgi:hypothetical protein